MAKKLQVRTPQTIDGTNLRYDEDNKVVYKTSIVELAARRNIMNLNARLPQHLHHIMEEIEVEDKPIGLTNEDLRKRLSELEAIEENGKLLARIAELEGKLEAKGDEAKGDEAKVLGAKAKKAAAKDEAKAASDAEVKKG